ncbi:MAG: type II toxin-antitoxin system RelE/ParE family toxin [Planctomycetes bacterium]|nr:type II toxin-antitoxin system RelE/ParE family toxin [Planctomycetota bacterium]
MKPVVIHRLARAELDEAMAFYERQQRGLGLDLQTEIQQAITHIQANPGLGSPYKATDFRYWVLRRFPYVLYYADLEDALWVVAIAHGSRRPDYWKRRRLE